MKLNTALNLFVDYGFEGILDRIREKVTKAPLWTEDTIYPPRLLECMSYCKLNVPQFETPLVSIIIPVYNQFHYTYLCIKSIINSVEKIPYEIIIGDDMSTDETSHIDDFITGISVNKNGSDHGFLMNCNRASKLARGKYILFLNNDTQVQYNWLESLVELIEHDEKIGLVGSKLIYPDGKLQEAGGIIFNDASGMNYGNRHNPNSPEYNYVKEVDYISGASILIRKSLWKEIDGFDEQFKPAYCEDSDFAFEVRKHGYKVVYQPKSVVVHFEGVSNGTDLSSGLKRYQVENQVKLLNKWKRELRDQSSPSDMVFLARERHNGKRILVMDANLPEYDMNAGNRTTYMYLKLFLHLGLKITFVPCSFKVKEPYLTLLTQLGIEVLCSTGYHNSITIWLKEHLQYFDFVYLQRPNPTIKYIHIIRKYFRGKIFYYTHDLHYIRLYREYLLTKDIRFLHESKTFKKIEHKIFKEVDVIYSVGNYELQVIKKSFSGKNIKNIPAYIYEKQMDNVEKDFSKRHDILFVGGFGHRPNIDAVEYFAKDVFPKISQKIPNIVWHIVGAKAPEKIKQLESRNIKLEGFCSDEELQRLYQTCRIVVVPLRYGAGVKGKVVEAAYNQIPIITTSIGAEGLDSSIGCFITEDDTDRLADLIVKTYSDFDALRKMSDAGKVFIEKYFTLEVAKNVLQSDMQI